jgi:hypothetical protein
MINVFKGIVYLGMTLYHKGYLSMGDITQFVIYTIHLSESMKDLNNSYNNLSNQIPMA